MTDDSGAYAVFAEQGSSASQMTAAKVMDVISRLPDCAGQAADAIPAYTQVKLEDAPKLLKKIFKIGMSRRVDTPSKTQMAEIMVQYGRPSSVPFERNLCGHPPAGLLWERQFEEAFMELGWEKVSKWECLFVHRKQKLFSSVYVWTTSK